LLTPLAFLPDIAAVTKVSSGLAASSACFVAFDDPDSCVKMNAVPIYTALAPRTFAASIARPVDIPPEAMYGMESCTWAD